SGDWSSDVCSSDLTELGQGGPTSDGGGECWRQRIAEAQRGGMGLRHVLSFRVQVCEAIADDAREAWREGVSEIALETKGVGIGSGPCTFETQHAVGRAETEAVSRLHLPGHAGCEGVIPRLLTTAG